MTDKEVNEFFKTVKIFQEQLKARKLQVIGPLVTYSSHCVEDGILRNKLTKVSIVTEENAKISKIYVKEGQIVAKGDLFDRLIEYINNDYVIDDSNGAFDKDNIDELEFYNYMYNYYEQRKLYEASQANMFKKETINNYLAERAKVLLQKQQYYSQLEAYSKMLEKYKIYAQIDGVVHFVREVDEGMYFGTGTSLAVINANEDVILEVFLSSSDKAKVSVGNHVSLTVDGLIQNEYGTVSGTLTKIDSDSTYTENGYFYKGIIKLDCQVINSKKNTVKFTPGLQFNARIIYTETSYLKYFLGQIGINIKK